MSSKKPSTDWIDKLSEEVLVCRDLHHAWKPHTAAKIKGGYKRELICRTCETIKEQRLDNYGYIEWSTYRYPEGYVRTGLGRITAAENALLRLTHIKGNM